MATGVVGITIESRNRQPERILGICLVIPDVAYDNDNRGLHNRIVDSRVYVNRGQLAGGTAPECVPGCSTNQR